MAADLLDFTQAGVMGFGPFLPAANPSPGHEISWSTGGISEQPGIEVSDYMAYDDDPCSSVVNCEREVIKRMRMDAAGRRIGFRMKSEVEILDDGFKWRKYGKKSLKNSPNPRNYYRCSSEGCGVKKRVERDRDDPRYVITTYEGVHDHPVPGTACCGCSAYRTHHHRYNHQEANSSSLVPFGQMQMPAMAPNLWSMSQSSNSSC